MKCWESAVNELMRMGDVNKVDFHLEVLDD